MKFILRIFTLLVVFSFCLLPVGCSEKGGNEVATPDSFIEKDTTDVTENSAQKEDNTPSKEYLSISTTKASFNKEQLLEKGDLIIRGKVLTKDSEVMTNPDGTTTDKNGHIITNEQIAAYTVEIDEVYKGSYDEETIEVKTSNGSGLSPDLILYGEDETTILGTPLDRFDMEPGAECIIILCRLETGSEITTGYYPFGPDCGYFLPDGNGNYVNQKTASAVTLSPDTLADEIAALS